MKADRLFSAWRRGLILFALVAAAPARAQYALDDMLPEGPGKDWVLEKCMSCHDLTPIVDSGFTGDGWEQQIHKMIGDDAGPDAQVKQAAAYLAKVFGPGHSHPTLAAMKAGPDANARKGVQNYVPVTSDMLLQPPDEDWLMFNRTYDSQRFSPLKQINTDNVKGLTLAWVYSATPGVTEVVPIVHGGVIYTVVPGGGVVAVNGVNGDQIWEYRRPGVLNATGKQRSLAIYQDLVIYTATDGNIVGLDAKDGHVHWETYVGRGTQNSGAIVAGDKIISARTCMKREDCFIAAHDALTGKELWKFQIVPAAGEPGAETWGDADMEKMVSAAWGLPGSYDPVRKTLYWGIANASPFARMVRNHGKYDATGFTAPVALYSNSTVALDVDTGKLKWYYQHLPGDDWDMDFTHERTLVQAPFNPDPKQVKWIASGVKRGEVHDMTVAVGEGGGIFALDRADGKFLWANQFPYNVPNFIISDIDPKTGKTHINTALIGKKPDDRHLICFGNTRSFWPMAYSPLTQSLYVAFNDNCLDMKWAGPKGGQRRTYVPRPGSDPDKFSGIAKVNMSTGEITRFGFEKYPGNGGILATAGNLIFHGDLNRRFSAFDARTGDKLWETILGGPIAVSTITYSAGGEQYILVMTGEGGISWSLAQQVGFEMVKKHNAIYAFKLPSSH